jgi:hypothetical protein
LRGMVEWERWGAGSRNGILVNGVHGGWDWCEHLKLSHESLGWAHRYPTFCHPHWVSKPWTLMRTQPNSQRTKVARPGILAWHLINPWWKLEGVRFHIDWALEFLVEQPKQTVFSEKSACFEVPDNNIISKWQPSSNSLILGKMMGLWDALLLHVLKVECLKSGDRPTPHIATGNNLIIRDRKEGTRTAFARSSLERGGNLH